jgi:NAD(P)-dependent dehydrogenase (short-subunit alcohol dehydrogenase family)
VAIELGRRGVSVFLVARREPELRAAADEVRAAGGEADFHACDLRVVPAVFDLVDIVLSRTKKLDILVNSAGVGFQASLPATKRSAIAEAVEINLCAPIYLTQAALPALRRSAPSDIVNVTSGLEASPDAAVLCATEAGLVGFSRSLALELAPDRIRVTTFRPPITGPAAARALAEALAQPPSAKK